MKALNYVIFIGLLMACSTEKSSSYLLKENQDVIGLCSPFSLSYGQSKLILTDYCLHPEKLDSITVGAGISLVKEGNELIITQTENALAMSSIFLWKEGTQVCIPIKTSKDEISNFKFDPQGKDYKSVQVKGEMNAWNVNANSLELKEGRYITEFVLAPGKYQYKLVLNGKEANDPANPDSVSNGIGGYNQIFQVGEVDQAPLFITASQENNIIRIAEIAEEVEYIALWNNSPVKAMKKGGALLLEMPANASDVDRSFVRVWAYDKNRISNDILIPLKKGKVLTDTDDITRSDKQAMSLYNVFMDRFYNGNSANDRPDASGMVLPKANNMGGDLRGLIDKVDAGFFEEIGVNTIWISPIVKNAQSSYGSWPEPQTKFSAYHGYWPISFTLIDERFGTAAELHELVGKAHARNLNVLLDFVANHVHEEHPYYKAHPEVATDLYLPDGTLNTERWDDHRLTTWFDTFMPSLRLDEPEVYNMLTDSAVFWIEQYNLDGFRHDATKHVPEVFWRTLTYKLKERVIQKGKHLYQIGETYGTRNLVASYVNSGELDGQFDFNVYDACVSALAAHDGSFVNLGESIQASLDAFGHHHLMGNITGNQDRARFISYAGGAVRLDEDAKKAGWSREVGVGDSVAYEKSKELFALVATLPGVPVIYYGDEIGSYGGNDPDNRKMMRFEGLSKKESELRTVAAELMQFRNSSLPLIYGDFRIHWKDEDTFVYSRNYFGDTVYVIYNDADEVKAISFRPDDDQYEFNALTLRGNKVERIENNMLSIKVPAHSFEIID